MISSIERGAGKLFEKPGRILVVLGLVVVCVGHRAVFIDLDNSPETFFAADRERQRVYRDMVRAFGADEVIVVQLRGASHQRGDDLLALARLTRQLAALEGVSTAFSLSNTIDSGDDALPEALAQDSIAEVAREVEVVPIYRELGLVGDAPPSLAVLVAVVMESTSERAALVRAIDEVVRGYETDERRALVAGLTTTHVAFDRLTRRSLFSFMPAVVLASLLVGLALFRSVKAVVALLVPAVGAVALGLAGLEIFGQSLNLVTAVLPPLVLAISFAASLHLITHYSTMIGEGHGPTEAARLTVREKLVPTAFAFGTTAVGFGSLALSPVSSIRALGAAVAGTLVVALVLVTMGTPALLLVLRPILRQPEHRRGVLIRFASFSLRRRAIVVVCAAILLAVFSAGTLRMEEAINGVDLLTPGSTERVAYETLESDGIGLGNLELWIDHEVPDLEALRGEVERLRRLDAALERLPGVTGALSAADVIAVADHRLARARVDGEPPRAVGDVALFYDLLAQTWRRDAGLRVTVMSRTAERPEELSALQEQVLAAAATEFPGSRARITGHYATLIGTPGALGETLAESLGLTVLVIAALFLAAFRSWRLALSGMIVNLSPVVAVLGVMGWIGVPLDVATVMTASVVFGLAVDDTFHYLYHRKKTSSVICAAEVAGQGIVATTFVVSIGFAVLALSGFAPVTRFGLIVSLGTILALAADAFLLPALVAHENELAAVCHEGDSRPTNVEPSTPATRGQQRTG